MITVQLTDRDIVLLRWAMAERLDVMVKCPLKNEFEATYDKLTSVKIDARKAGPKS